MVYDIPKDLIISVIGVLYPKAKIYLFGSRARGDFKVTSDIDIAIDNGGPLTMEQKGQLFNLIDALNIPQKTDLVDFHRAPEALKENILKEGILWKS